MSDKKKILIVENDQGQFRMMSNKFNKFIGDRFEVFPKEFSGDKSFNNYSILIDEVQHQRYQNILEHYQDIDIFIIDNSLIGDDHYGTEFRNEIKNINYRNGNYFIFFLTNTAEQWVNIKDWDLVREKYVPKVSHEYEIDTYILNEVAIKAGIDLDKILTEKGDVKEKQQLKEVKESNKDDKAAVKKERFVHHCILFLFYVLLLVTGANATINISLDFANGTVRSFKKTFIQVRNFNKSNKTDSISTNNANINEHHTDSNDYSQKEIKNVEHKEDEGNALETIERIYIYLLPFFIVFGFYNYYKGSASISLLGGNTGTINPLEATRTMKMTKVLFISSMISYVVIKVIEILFDSDPSWKVLISSGILILILMIYFIYLEMEGKSDEKDKTHHKLNV